MFEIEIVEGTINQEVVQTVIARDLHAGLGVGRDYHHWIKARIEKYGFTQGIDFINAKNNNRIECHVTLDMAKELSMVERTDKGKEARQYFIKMEKKAVAQPSQPQLSDQVLLAQIELDKHKVELEKHKASEETKRMAIKAKVQVAEASRIRMDHDRKSMCGKGYSSLASIHKWLEMDNDTPLAYSMLQAVLRKHSMSINTRSNCINEGDFFSELELVTNGAEKTKSGKFWYYEPSDIKFKADWL